MDHALKFTKLPRLVIFVLAACFSTALLMSGTLFNQAASAAPSFQPKTDFATGQNPYSVVSADFNGDSKADLATANLGSNNVSVLFGNGSGGFGAKADYPSESLNATVAITSGDFNGDNKPDLATANPSTDGFPGGDQILVFLNDGFGGFGTPVVYNIASPNPAALTIGDFNDDERIDLAFASSVAPGGAAAVMLALDSGGLGPDTFFDAGSDPSSVVSLDFNGDGKPDLATANGDGSVGLLFNGVDGDTAGYFNSHTTFQTGTSNSRSITSGDFNGDGKPDLATANTFANGGFINNVSVLLGNGNRSLLSGATTFPTAKGPIAIANADFTGDGKPDLATANYGADSVSVLPGNGSGGFGSKTDFATGQVPYSVTTADFNGDGKPDLATANSSSNNVSVLLGKGSAPDPGPGPDPDPGPEPGAKIGSVKVKGPGKVKKGKKVAFKVKISNSGDADATAVKLKVSGKGVKAKKQVGTIAPAKTRMVKVKLKFKKPGKIKVKIKVTSKNAGSKTKKMKIKVRK